MNEEIITQRAQGMRSFIHVKPFSQRPQHTLRETIF